MKKVSRIILLGSTLLCLNTTYSNPPTTFLGPTLRGSFTSPVTSETAYSFAGEAGIKNFRVSGTFAWKLDEEQRFKFTGEYLWQRITYAFFNGNTDQWVNQGAIGADYQYVFANVMLNPEFNFEAYYS